MVHIHRLPTRRGSWMAGFHQPSTVVTMTRYTAPRPTARTMPSRTFSTVSPTSSYSMPTAAHTLKTMTM